MTFTTVSRETKLAYEAKMEECLDVCRAKKPGLTIPTPKLNFRQMGRQAGLCTMNYYSKTCTLTINPDFLKKHAEDMINNTLPHEVAHYVAGFIFGREAHGHGMYWKIVMGWLGLHASERCHQYDLEGVKTRNVRKPYQYQCGCSDPNMVTPYVHNKILNGAKYTCRRCKKRITYVGMSIGQKFIPRPVQKPEPVIPVFINLTLAPVKPIEPPVAPKPDFSNPTFKVVTRFIDGTLQNIRVPVMT